MRLTKSTYGQLTYGVAKVLLPVCQAQEFQCSMCVLCCGHCHNRNPNIITKIYTITIYIMSK